MTIIAGLNNRGVSITIQIEGQDVIIPPGKFIIQKQGDKFIAVKPSTNRYANLGNDLGCITFETDLLTVVSEIECGINVGQFNRIFGAGLDDPNYLAQGLNMCANIDEAVPNNSINGGAALFNPFGIKSYCDCDNRTYEYSAIANDVSDGCFLCDSISRFRIKDIVLKLTSDENLAAVGWTSDSAFALKDGDTFIDGAQDERWNINGAILNKSEVQKCASEAGVSLTQQNASYQSQKKIKLSGLSQQIDKFNKCLEELAASISTN